MLKVTVKEARNIAQTYIEEPGATAGTPKLVDNTYVVPIMLNGETVGLIYIDPDTGKNIGGAGGAPIG